MIQIHKGNNRRYMGEPLHLWGDGQPEDVDSTPEYFDKVIEDITDRETSDPMSSLGVSFRLFLGNPREDYYWADFVAHGVEKTLLESGAPEYRLQWERLTEWRQRPKPNNTKEAKARKEVGARLAEARAAKRAERDAA